MRPRDLLAFTGAKQGGQAELAKMQGRQYVFSVVKQRMTKIKDNGVQKRGMQNKLCTGERIDFGNASLPLPTFYTNSTYLLGIYLGTALTLRELKQGTGLVNGKSAMAIALCILGLDWYPALLFSSLLDAAHAWSLALNMLVLLACHLNASLSKSGLESGGCCCNRAAVLVLNEVRGCLHLRYQRPKNTSLSGIGFSAGQGQGLMHLDCS